MWQNAYAGFAQYVNLLCSFRVQKFLYHDCLFLHGASTKGKSDPSFEFTLIYLKILIIRRAMLHPDKPDARDPGVRLPLRPEGP